MENTSQFHYQRSFETVLLKRLKERPLFIQTILGPRQVGKTSGVLNVLESNFDSEAYHYTSCEEGLHDADWFLNVVQKSLVAKKKILVFDEIQKIENWSELVKLVWDRQKKSKSLIHLVLLGSSSLQISQGLNESLAGRFEIIPVHHWTFFESQKAFNISFNDYLSYGGYPGSYPLISENQRFQKYMMDSVFESVVGKDIVRYSTVRKPALFRQTFALACQFPAQEVSYNKLIGQLQDAGNVDQVKYYLDLYSQAFLIRLIYKWTKSAMTRTSSPKLLPCAPVFTSLFLRRELTPEEKGRVFESIVGSRLCEAFDTVYFWREGREEVDYVVETGKELFAIEVKSKKRKTSGMEVFRKKNVHAKTCYIDFENYPMFEKDPVAFLNEYAI
jgi:predicted AAA+ superfamily ATPase